MHNSKPLKVWSFKQLPFYNLLCFVSTNIVCIFIP